MAMYRAHTQVTNPTKYCIVLLYRSLSTNLLKKEPICQLLSPIITNTCIINHSLGLSYVPKDFKTALVRSTLNKEDAIRTELSNYRPVSNLMFLSKILEKVVASQIMNYLEENGISDPFQSAYRQAHSTETAMMKVKNDIDAILDEGDAALLVLLDLSAAFETIVHVILLQSLNGWYRWISIGVRALIPSEPSSESKCRLIMLKFLSSSDWRPTRLSARAIPLRALCRPPPLLTHTHPLPHPEENN